MKPERRALVMNRGRRMNAAGHEWLRGILDMAELVEEWDGYVDHPYRLSDCLLLKLNLLPDKRYIRRNKKRVS